MAVSSNTTKRKQQKNNDFGRYFFNGNWDNGSQNGAFVFNVNNASSNSNTNIGLRVANNRTARRWKGYGPPSSAYLFGSAVHPAKGKITAKTAPL